MGGLIGQYVTNKLSPSTSLLYKMLNSRVKKIDGEMVRVNEFGQPLPFPESIADNMYPIYYETISELYKDQPETVATFLSGAAFFGLGVQTYEDKKRKDK